MSGPKSIKVPARLQEQLQKIRHEFLVEAVQFAEELEDLIRLLQDSQGDGAVRERVAKVAHHLAGTVESFGAVHVSNSARTLNHEARESLCSGKRLSEVKLNDWLERASAIHKHLCQAADLEELRAAPSVHPSLNPGRILVVEDNALHARWLTMILESAGHTLRVCSNATGVPKALDAFEPELLVLDVGLPDGSGHTIAELIRRDALRAALPIVFVTGGNGGNERLQALQSGADDFICKPADPALLLSSVEGRLQRFQELNARDVVDSVTHLLNRQHFYERLKAASQLLDEGIGQDGTLVFLRVDDFEELLANSGRALADDVLRLLSRLVHSHLGLFDLAGRYGDAEFALFLSGATPSVAKIVCEKLLSQFFALRHTNHSGASVHASFSAAVTSHVSGQTSIDSWCDGVREAASSIQAAGGNRVAIVSIPAEAELSA